MIAITETICALEHLNCTISPADMPVGFEKGRCPPRAAAFLFCIASQHIKIIFRLVISNTSKAFKVRYDKNHDNLILLGQTGKLR